MAWVVDTCVVLDVFLDDPVHVKTSADLLKRLQPDGLLVCPVTSIELSPAFAGNLSQQREFLRQCGIRDDADWTEADTRMAHQVWNFHIQNRRSKKTIKRPIADILIGAFAMSHQGLITRNVDDFRLTFPTLKLRSS